MNDPEQLFIYRIEYTVAVKPPDSHEQLYEMVVHVLSTNDVTVAINTLREEVLNEEIQIPKEPTPASVINQTAWAPVSGVATKIMIKSANVVCPVEMVSEQSIIDGGILELVEDYVKQGKAKDEESAQGSDDRGG